jgi:hypothetical protein
VLRFTDQVSTRRYSGLQTRRNRPCR